MKCSTCSKLEMPKILEVLKIVENLNVLRVLKTVSCAAHASREQLRAGAGTQNPEPRTQISGRALPVQLWRHERHFTSGSLLPALRHTAGSS